MSTQKSIFIGQNEATFLDETVSGELISFDREKYYKITNNDAMRPFLYEHC